MTHAERGDVHNQNCRRNALAVVIVHVVGVRDDVAVPVLSRLAVRGHYRFVLNGHAHRDFRAVSGFAKHKINRTLGNRRLDRGIFSWLQLPLD